MILTGNRNHGAISAEGRKSYYTEKADDTTTLWTPSAAGIAVGVANATLTDNHNYASINGSDGYAGGITSTIDETSAFAGTNTNTGNITGWRAGGIAASADGGVTLGAGLSSGGTIAPVDLNYDVVDRYSDPAAIGGIGMLLWQGVAAFQLFTGKEMPVEEVQQRLFALDNPGRSLHDRGI